MAAAMASACVALAFACVAYVFTHGTSWPVDPKFATPQGAMAFGDALIVLLALLSTASFLSGAWPFRFALARRLSVAVRLGAGAGAASAVVLMLGIGLASRVSDTVAGGLVLLNWLVLLGLPRLLADWCCSRWAAIIEAPSNAV